MDFKVIRS